MEHEVYKLTLKHLSPDSEDTFKDYQVLSKRLRRQSEEVLCDQRWRFLSFKIVMTKFKFILIIFLKKSIPLENYSECIIFKNGIYPALYIFNTG